MSNAKWQDDSLQFPRLLCEIIATQEHLDIRALATSMDLSTDEVDILFDRAHRAWERAKRQDLSPPERYGAFGDKPCTITIEYANRLTPDTRPLLDACIARVLAHHNLASAAIYVGERVPLDAPEWKHPGWLEFNIDYRYTDGGKLYVGAIQRKPGEPFEFHS